MYIYIYEEMLHTKVYIYIYIYKWIDIVIFSLHKEYIFFAIPQAAPCWRVFPSFHNHGSQKK